MPRSAGEASGRQLKPGPESHATWRLRTWNGRLQRTRIRPRRHRHRRKRGGRQVRCRLHLPRRPPWSCCECRYYHSSSFSQHAACDGRLAGIAGGPRVHGHAYDPMDTPRCALGHRCGGNGRPRRLIGQQLLHRTFRGKHGEWHGLVLRNHLLRFPCNPDDSPSTLPSFTASSPWTAGAPRACSPDKM